MQVECARDEFWGQNWGWGRSKRMELNYKMELINQRLLIPKRSTFTGEIGQTTI